MIRFPIEAGEASLRPLRLTDAAAIARHADSREVWRNLTHVFPHPYTVDDAKTWLATTIDAIPPQDLAITLADEFVGVCGLHLGEGVSRYTGSVGYWLGRDHWGRGIASASFSLFVEYVWENFDLKRLQAEVFSWNPASARVLEKCGFVLEGTRRRAILKDDQLIDEWFYSLLHPDVEPT